MVPNLHLEIGKTIGIIIWMYEILFSTGKYVVMDSSFCVANKILALMLKVVYSRALIKKCRYWPKIVPGDLIGGHFSYK